MSRKIFTWTLVIVIVAIALGGYSYYHQTQAAAQQAIEETPIQTTVVRRGNLVLSASGTGSIIPENEIKLAFQNSGRISELLVAVGDEVKAGDVLAVMESSDSSTSLELQVSSAELTVLKAQISLNELKEDTDNSVEIAQRKQELAQSEVDLLTAQEELEDLSNHRLIMQGSRCADDTIDDYQKAYDGALKRYQRDPGETTLQGVNTALANLNYCTGVWTEEELAAADAGIELAKSQIELLEAEIETTEKEIQELESTTGPDPDDVALAEAELANAQAQLVIAQESLQETPLTAPLDGTILTVDVQVGDDVGTSAIITMADLSQPMLEVYVDETDMNNIGIGYEIEVIFDALPDQTFGGQIVSIDPSLSTIQNVSAIRALAKLDTQSFTKPQTLPVGLNASVEIIGSRTENALLVPVEALRELSEGKYGVFVMENGEPVLRVVEVGIMDFTYAEIKSGLEEGETVTTGIVETGQ